MTVRLNQDVARLLCVLLVLAPGCGPLKPLLPKIPVAKRERGFRVVDGVPVYRDHNAGDGQITRQIPNVDSATFRALDQPKDAKLLYATDAKRVYMAYLYSVNVLPDADCKTFDVLTPDGCFTRDVLHNFYMGVTIEGADPATFQILDGAFAKDKQTAYVGTATIPVADIASWKPLQRGHIEHPWYRDGRDSHPVGPAELNASGWSRDSENLYYGKRKIVEADAATFELLSDYYGRDKGHVYYADRVIPDADPKTFRVQNGPFFPGTKTHSGPGPEARDAHRKYHSGEPVTNL